MADNSGNFWGGFLFGAIVGGAVGALVTIKLSEPDEESSDRLDNRNDNDQLPNRSSSNEFARRNLEKKISQLNAAIDSVSQELAMAEGKNGRSQQSLDTLADNAP
ncbi:MAG: hypothetical protein NW214_09260 [Pseudanabaenaceae cyanobacterium bins.39]|nr:hypothetical protein [Pseudanabaenaceae cyanobacterium bins.39]